VELTTLDVALDVALDVFELLKLVLTELAMLLADELVVTPSQTPSSVHSWYWPECVAGLWPWLHQLAL
jgi:hypothetical protein